MKNIFKSGDKVRFLNTVGSGVVSRVTASGVIYVNIEDGFEIPCQAQDLVIIESEESAAGAFRKKGEFDSLKMEVAVEEPKEEILEPVQKKEKYAGEKPEKGLYYLIVPHNEEMPLVGKADVYLVNYSSMELYYRFMLHSPKAGDYTLKTGIMEAGDAVLLSEISQPERVDWLKAKVQFLCVDRKSEKMFPAHVISFQIKEQKLLNEAHFRSNAFFDEMALMQTVLEFKNLDEEHVQAAQNLDALKEALGAVKKEPRKRMNSTLIDRHIKGDGFAEVDLHIEKLRGDYKKLHDEEKVRTQISYFSQCLDSAMAKDLKRVVFIHGVGQGILKDKIRKILDDYENVKYQQASLLKYGDGATEVFFN